MSNMDEQLDFEEFRVEMKEFFTKNREKIDQSLTHLQWAIYPWMQAQGFWESDNKGEKIALMHSELSECLEAVRKGDVENEVEELADCTIRIIDYCGRHGLQLGEAIVDKMMKNLDRPRKHGKGF